MNKAHKLTLFAIILLFQGCAVVQKDNSPNNIISKFTLAVAQKDVTGFKALFLNEEVSWLAVRNDKDLIGEQKQKVHEHGLVNFIEMAASTKESTEVQFSDCNVMNDGDIATAYCMYSFHLGGKMTNDGREAFLFVNTATGWKISGMVFSSTLAKK